MLKPLLLTVALFLAFTPPLYAGPASPDPIDIVLPDGSSIRARIRGDEFQGWTESEDTGHTIIKNKASGYWEYAEQAEDGSLRLSGIRVSRKGGEVPPATPKGLRPPRHKDLELRMHQMLNDVYQQRLESSSMVSPQSSAPSDGFGAEAAPGDWLPVPVSGARNALIVLINFADRALQTTPANWYTSVFDENARSVAKYFKDNSFGLMTVSPVPHTQIGSPAGVVSVMVPDTHPNYGKDYVAATEKTILNHALAHAATFVNFAGYDSNGNGALEQSELTIYFIYAGYEASGSTKAPNVWAHAYSTTGTGITAGTKNVQRWAQSGELNDSSVLHPMGVIAHELGHALCGLPDLYDVSGQNQGLGNFSLMAGGSWGRDYSDPYGGTTPTSLDAWSREFLGWTVPLVPATSGTISLGHVLSTNNAAYKLAIPAVSATEYFLVENRQPVDWDKGLRGNFGSTWPGGLLILHIDSTAGTFPNNNINSYTANSTTPGHQGVLPVQAKTSPCDMLSVGASCRGHSTTLFYSANNTNLTSSSVPSSNYYNSTPTHFNLTAISLPESTMTAFLLLPPAAPGASTLGAAPVAATTATLNGSVNDNNAATTVAFDYGLTTGYGGSVSAGLVSAGTGGTTVSASISGLACNTAYHFRVKATNSVDTTFGTDKTFTSTACVPGAPTIISASAGNAMASIAFAPPVLNGGSAITGYRVVPNIGQPVTGTEIPINVPNLINGNAYTFTVTATNAAGTGQASVASAVVIPGVVVVDDANETGYQLVQPAYDANASGGKIKLQAGTQVGGLTVDSSNAKEGPVTLLGGYDNAFLDDNGPPSILGTVTLSGGTTRFQNVIVRAP